MSTPTLLSYPSHHHNFSRDNQQGERRTRLVLILTAITMVAEIVAGSLYGSMALLADGWHMGTHVAAFMITLFAYRYAKAHADNHDFSFGTGKVSVLGGFASAVALAVVALLMLIESAERMLHGQTIHFSEAIAVAIVGLLVNLLSVLLLQGQDHHHHHHHDHNQHDHGTDHHHGHHHDHNLKAAYLHVLADALTSLLAIVALLFGKFLGWNWLDPLMGIVGAVVITRWAWGLLKDTAPILLDGGIDQTRRQAIRQAIEHHDGNRVVDLHIWRVSAHHYAAIVALVSDHPRPPTHYKTLLEEFDWLAHLTVEVNPRSPGMSALQATGS